MLVHEVGEVLVGVLAEAVLLEQLVEVADHLVDGGLVLVGGVLEGFLHPLEALVEHLPAEEVLDLLVVLAGLLALPVVVGELAHRRRRARRQVAELHLAEVAVGVVQVDVTGQLLALLEHRSVEELLDLLHRAVEVVLAEQLTTLVGDLAGQVVEAALVLPATTQELAHRALGRVPRHHVLADGVQRLGQVDGRRERVRATVVPAVAGAADVRPPSPARGTRLARLSHRRPRRPRTPCSPSGRGTGPRGRARWLRRARRRWSRRAGRRPRRRARTRPASAGRSGSRWR